MTTTHIPHYSTGYPEADAWIERQYQQLDDEYEQQLETARQLHRDRMLRSQVAVLRPPGYRGQPPFFRNQDGSINRSEVQMMGRAKELRSAGCGWKEVARRLTDDGYMSRRGKPHSDTSINSTYSRHIGMYDTMQGVDGVSHVDDLDTHCYVCDQRKSRTEFYRDCTRKIGVSSKCKICADMRREMRDK